MFGTSTHAPSSKSILALILYTLILFAVGSADAFAMALLWGEPPTPIAADLTMSGTTIMVPVRVVEQFGGSFKETDAAVTVHLGESSIQFSAGSNEAVVNGRTIRMPAAAHGVAGEMWVPLRTMAEHMLKVRISFRSGDVHLIPWSPLTALVPTQPTPEPTDHPTESAVPGQAPQHPDAAIEPGPEAQLPPDEEKPAPAVEPDPDLSMEPVKVPTEVPAAPELPSVSPDGTHGPAEGYTSISGIKQVPSAISMTVYKNLHAPTRPRLKVLFPTDAGRRETAQLPPLKPTMVRAQRVDWIEAQLVKDEAGKDALRVTGSKPFTYHTFLLTNPARLVIDITGLDTGHAQEPLAVYGTNIQRVRLNQNSPNVVRLVIDLLDTVGYSVQATEAGNEVTVVLNHILRKVTGEFDELSGTVSLDIPKDADYRVLRLSDPERLVIDLHDTTLSEGLLAQLPTEGPVWNWRIHQFDPSTTRLVFEIARHLDIAPLPQHESLTFQVGHQVRGIGYAQLPGLGLVMHIAGAKLPDASVMYLVEPDRLVVDLPGTVLAEPLNDTIIDLDLVWRIRSGQHPDRVRVVFELVGSVEYEVVRLPEDQGLAVVVMPPSLAGRSVFLDPGHGGDDPGAIGRVKGLMEKHVVLDVALRLRALLEAAGAKVDMSREGDTFIELPKRPAMARAAGSDVFLSIHANDSLETNIAGGTETYMFIRPNHPENARFASAVQRHLVSATGLLNRGVKQANFAVLRTSYIPSALAEIAFLSREEEEYLLNEDWFRQQVAQGLFNGLVAFFNDGASRAAHLSESERQAVEEGIAQALVNDGFSYLTTKGHQVDGAVGAVRVQPLSGG